MTVGHLSKPIQWHCQLQHVRCTSHCGIFSPPPPSLLGHDNIVHGNINCFVDIYYFFIGHGTVLYLLSQSMGASNFPHTIAITVITFCHALANPVLLLSPVTVCHVRAPMPSVQLTPLPPGSIGKYRALGKIYWLNILICHQIYLPHTGWSETSQPQLPSHGYWQQVEGTLGLCSWKECGLDVQSNWLWHPNICWCSWGSQLDCAEQCQVQ